ncbi:MAG: hypothetical protein A2Y21_03170 [Clostridiales bacterium GWC2_40_7]|nr:MAG: hypothetical protein A2Y21_03170 [Clostridiales bacterium GWC2_40_7]
MKRKTLAGKGTKTIGLIVPEIISSYFAQMVNYIEAELKSLNYSLIIGVTHHNYEAEVQHIGTLITKKVDGIILAGSMHKQIEEQLVFVKNKYNMPMVLIQTLANYPGYNCIIIDDKYGFLNAIELLSTLGHTRIGFVADEESARLRFEFFKSSMLEKGMVIDNNFIKIGKERFEYGGYLRMKELLEQKTIPTAVFSAYDNVAIGVMKAVQESGLSIPEDISIVSFDNIRESEYLYNPLTTISPPIKDMCRIGVKLLIEKVKDKDNKLIQHISLKPELIIRNTTASIKTVQVIA